MTYYAMKDIFVEHEIPFIFDKASQPIQLVVHLLEHQLDAFKQEVPFDCVEKMKGRVC